MDLTLFAFLKGAIILAQAVYFLFLRRTSDERDEEVWNACLAKGE